MVTNFSARLAQPCVSSKKLQSSFRGRINFNLICLPMSYYHSNSTPAAAAAARGRRRFLLQFHDNFFPSFAFGPFQKPRSDLMPFSLMLLFLISMNQSTTTRMAVFLASNVFSLLLLLLLCYFFVGFMFGAFLVCVPSLFASSSYCLQRRNRRCVVSALRGIQSAFPTELTRCSAVFQARSDSTRYPVLAGFC